MNAVSHSENQRGQGIVPVLLILPAILLGILAMLREGVSPVLWGQQAAAFVICLLAVRPMRRVVQKAPSALLMAVLMIFLAVSLLGVGAGGAKRWVNMGIFNANAAMLVLPALLILLGGMRHAVLLLCASVVLCIQPDFSQLTALLAASFPLLLSGSGNRGWSIFCAAAQIVLAVICLRIPVAMEPVPYCEGVMAMLGGQSWPLWVLGAGSLLMIPGFWVWRYWKKKNMWMLSLAIYYATVICFGLSGEYPMPFMGFGMSAILGYGLAVAVMPEG